MEKIKHFTQMMREIDTNRNSREDLKMVINYLADAIDKELDRQETIKIIDTQLNELNRQHDELFGIRGDKDGKIK
jgi:CCR4-NOT transcriptional regulation complex NOT5 subunit